MRLKILGLLMVCIWQICVAAETKPADELEKLFEAGQYQEFFKVAPTMAEQGNADALFLLGKAYHLGKGVNADPEQARHFYNLAARQNSARAEHDLGVMDLDQDDRPDLALKHFYRALELGLRLPTLYNLGKLHMAQCNQRAGAESCSLAGDSFLQAWTIERNNDALDRAVMAYATACFINRRQAFVLSTEEDQPEAAAGCRQATKWADKGAELGLARATFNRGAIELDAGHYAEALPWFRLANERGLGLAAYTMGEMQENGRGLPKDKAAALEWFKRGAELKNEQAIQRMRGYWQDQISASFDPARIKAAIAELAKLESAPEPPPQALYRLQLIETLAANVKHFPSLTKESVPARFCPEHEVLYENTEWRIFAVSQPEDTISYAEMLPVLAQGMFDAKGCLPLTATARTKLRQALSKGATLMISWPGQRRLISVIRGPRGDLILKTGLKIPY